MSFLRGHNLLGSLTFVIGGRLLIYHIEGIFVFFKGATCEL